MIRIIIDLVKFSVVFALMIFSYLANAQKLESSLLWKISGNGIEKPSYLYGTMHAVCETNINDAVLKALDETSQLYLEIDMDDPNLQATMMRKIMMNDGITISSLITKDEAKKLDTFLKDNIGFSLQMIDTFKPFMISSMYLPKLLDCPMKAVDMELMKIAKEQNEEIYGLESIEDQMNVFDKIPYKIQVEELLKASNDNLISDKDEMAKMLAVYKSENIEGLLSISKESESKMFTEYENDLIVQRNKNWIPVIEETTKLKPTFFAVGAAHLAGEEGVIKLLRKKGYKVEAVN